MSIFGVRNKSTGEYAIKKNLYKYDKDYNKAYPFRRKCDASQMMNRQLDGEYLKVGDYEIVDLIAIAKQEEEAKWRQKHYRLQPLNHSLSGLPLTGRVVGSLIEAESLRVELCSKNHLHADYVTIKETYDPITPSPAYIGGRPSWDDYLIGLAFAVSQRSHDSQTKHGCVLTDQDHRILGTGYNGFPRGMDDKELPTTRPEKYDWMIHSEINALSNCSIRPYNGICYLTGEPCLPCLMQLHQNGIKKVICGAKYCWQKNDEESRKRFDKFVAKSKIQIVYAEPNLSWLTQLTSHIDEFRKR